MIMSKLFFISLSVFITVLLTGGCRKDSILSNEQEVLFQYEYRNDAEGKRLEGFFIDRQGNVLTYRNPAEWNHPDQVLSIYSDLLSANLDKCTVSEKHVSAAELEKYSRLISNISSSKVSAARHSGTGAGTHRFICYSFDEAAKTYKGYLIRAEGEISRENLNFYSKKIVAWMKDVNRDITDYQSQLSGPQ